MPFPYTTIAITGASTGLGRELALQLAAQGCKVGLMARRAELLQELAKQIRDQGGHAVYAACDVGDFAQVRHAVESIEAELGPIECMVANAGIGMPRERLVFEAEATAQIYRTNVLGMMNAFYAVIPGMLERKRGHLVGVSSLASYQGLPQDGGYAGSKAATRVHCEGLRLELRATGIKVTTICPGFVRTPLTDRNEFDMPLLMEVKPAVKRMIRAIARRRRIYHFPLLMWWVVKFGLATPRWLFDAFLSAQTANINKGRTQALSNGKAP